MARDHRAIVDDLIRTAHEAFFAKDTGMVRVFVGGSRYESSRWVFKTMKPARAWDSVILPVQVKEDLLLDAKEFLDGPDFYRERALPHRRGYLLHGLPGAGKTSLIGAMAGKLSVDIYMVSLGNKNLDDASLADLLHATPSRCIVLLEDIDCAMPNRKSKEDDVWDSNSDSDKTTKKKKTPKKAAAKRSDDLDGRRTLSGLLNALDGIASSEGKLMFFTINHVEKIDPALSRPGRCDVWVEFKHATKQQARDLFVHFYCTRPSDIDRRDDQCLARREKSAASTAACNEKLFGLPLGKQLPLSLPLSPPPSPPNGMAEIPVPHETHELADQFAQCIPIDSVSLSALQGYLLRYKRRPEEAVRGAAAWVESGYKQGPTSNLVAA